MRPSTFHTILTLVTIFTMKATAQIPIRLITHNIRYATTSPFKGEKPWADRRPLLTAELKFHTLYNPESFICLQEVLHQQLLDIMSDLNSPNSTSTLNPNSTETLKGEWAYIGVGRNDGKQAGEYSPILYRPDIWNLESWKTVWLSETPEVPGKGWDAASVRILTLGRFKHHRSGATVFGLNTHLDDQGVVSRRESAKLIIQTMDYEARDRMGTSVGKLFPMFLAGDLNSEPEEDAYRLLDSEDSVVQDIKELTGMRYGERSTFTGFENKQRTEIDHVFVGPRGGGVWEVRGYSVLANRFEDGVYVSDHRAVVGDVVLKV
jgi:endonuclease/exonuclease/phosphatase family metal-dependent hydrolase